MKRLHEEYRCAWSADSQRLLLTPSAFARESLYYLQEAGHFWADSTYYTCRENLDSFLVVYTLAGRGRLTTAAGQWELPPGSVFFIDCNQWHDYRTAADSWELLWVHFHGSGSRGYHNRFAAGAGRPVLETPAPETAELLQTLLQLAAAPGRSAELMLSLTLTQLLTVLTLCAGAADGPDPVRLSYVDEVTQYIDRHLAERLTLERLAAVFARNRYTLLRDFRQRTGLPPGEYIISRRVNTAKELLKYTDQSVRQIAWQVGVENESHFIRLFSARTGQTPGAYRALWCVGEGEHAAGLPHAAPEP